MNFAIKCPFPSIIRLDELFEYWLNCSGIPNWYFIKCMANFTESDELRKAKLRELCEKTAEGKSEFHRYCNWEKWTFIEVLNDFTSTFVPLNYMIDLMGLQIPWSYSISSSKAVYKKGINITVGVNRYKTFSGWVKTGLCSRYLTGLWYKD